MLYHKVAYSLPTVNISNAHKILFVTEFLATFVTLLITIMNTRLKQFLAAENITQSQFADTINVVRASVSHVLSGRNNPGYDFIKAIMTAYPALSMEWLILGRGKMYRESPMDATTVGPEPDFTPIYHEPNLFEEINIPDMNPVDSTYEPEMPPVEPSPAVTQVTLPPAVVKQRKVVKVTIFFDDGTYQEM